MLSSKPLESPPSTGSSPHGNGVSGENQLDEFGEPFDFKSDDFVSAVEKLLQGKLAFL